MKTLGQINNREIIYIKHDISTMWFNDLPEKNWLLFAIVDYRQPEIFSEIARRSIDNNIVYLCATGQKCEDFHDSFDEEMVIRDIENQYLPSYCIVTTWHDDFDEGFWFASIAAIGDTDDINKIICLDISQADSSAKIKDLITKINNGWTPSE